MTESLHADELCTHETDTERFEKLQNELIASYEADKKRHFWINELVKQCIAIGDHNNKLSYELKQAQQDMDFLEYDNQRRDEELECYRRLSERNPFVMVLIDGNEFMFNDLLAIGEEGGKSAATLIHDNILAYAGRSKPSLAHDLKVMIRAYGSVADLKQDLSNLDRQVEASQLEAFIRGFGCALPTCDWIDPGPNSKHVVVEKLIANSENCILNQHCHQVVFGCSSDPSYFEYLKALAADETIEVKGFVLLHQPGKDHTELADLPFHVISFEHIFKDRRVSQQFKFNPEAEYVPSKSLSHSDDDVAGDLRALRDELHSGSVELNDQIASHDTFNSFAPFSGRNPFGASDPFTDSSRAPVPNPFGIIGDRRPSHGSSESGQSGASTSLAKDTAPVFIRQSSGVSLNSTSGSDLSPEAALFKSLPHLPKRTPRNVWTGIRPSTPAANPDQWPALPSPIDSGFKESFNTPPSGGVSLRSITPSPQPAKRNPYFKPAYYNVSTKVPRNKLGQRIDPIIRKFSKEDINRVKDMKLCNKHYLLGECPYDPCIREHHKVLSAIEQEILKLVARKAACDKGTACDNYKCTYGHRCTAEVREPAKKGRNCVYGETCLFPEDMHITDLQPVENEKKVAVTGGYKREASKSRDEQEVEPKRSIIDAYEQQGSKSEKDAKEIDGRHETAALKHKRVASLRETD